jgi:hypothetical protein
MPEPQPASPTAGLPLLDFPVSDPDGAVFPDASVILTNQLTNVRIHQKSDDRGYATFLDIPAGTYTIEVEACGFEVVKKKNLELSIGQPSRIEIHLHTGEHELNCDRIGVIARQDFVRIPLFSPSRLPFLDVEPLPPPKESGQKRRIP